MKNNKQQLEKVNVTRRKALMGATTGVVAAGVWQTPVINSVILPAHAGMSEVIVELVDFEAGGASGGVTPTSSNDAISFMQKALDQLMPQAHAGVEFDPCAQEVVYVEPLVDRTKILAEAINNGNGTYDLTIIALISGPVPLIKKVIVDECKSESSSLVIEEEEDGEFIPRLKWTGTLGPINVDGELMDVAGCGRNEMGAITAVTETTMSISMTYFENEISFELVEGPITLPEIECYEPTII